MPDDRTPEQLAACRALHHAIDAVAKAYDDPGLLMEWIVITAHHFTGDDGIGLTGIAHIVSDDLPHYRAMGLLDYTLEQHRDRLRCRGHE